MIKSLVEKLYYRVFPDRVHEHDFALIPTEPNPVILVDRYRPEKIMVEVRIPREALAKNAPPIEWIKEDLASALVDRIKEYMTIERCDDPASHFYGVYRGFVRILKEEGER